MYHVAKHLFFILIVSTVLVFISGCSETDAQKNPPNIIIIFTDDQGYGDLSSYGHPTIHTPNLDRMAAEGTRFTQFYVTASVCTPSRAGLLTGRLPIRSGMKGDNYRVLFPNSKGGLPQDEITIASALKEKGYATAAIGKWHLGHLPEFLPTSHGFDYFYGIPYSNDMSPDTNPGWQVAQRFPPLPLMRNTETIEEEPDQRFFTRNFTEETINFIRENRDGPFFIYLPHVMPHTPLYTTEDFKGSSRRGLYGDTIEELDWSTGEIIAELEELGIAENTFVFYTSDNGPWLREGFDGGSAAFFRAGKGTTWEGGFRVPAIAWWPGTIPQGQVLPAMSSTLDLFTTSLKIAGADIPTDRIIDGVNLMPVLLGETEEVRDTFPFYRNRNLYAFRKGPWKAHFITEYDYVPDTRRTEHDPPKLFHLEHDPEEQFNVADQHPEILEELMRAVEEHKTSIIDVESQIDRVEWEF